MKPLIHFTQELILYLYSWHFPDVKLNWTCYCTLTTWHSDLLKSLSLYCFHAFTLLFYKLWCIFFNWDQLYIGDLVPTWIDQPVGCGKAGRELRPRRWERNLKTRLLRPAQTPSPLQRRTAQASLSLSPPRQLLSWTISGSRNVRLSLRLSQMSHGISKKEEILNEKRRSYQNVFILI